MKSTRFFRVALIAAALATMNLCASVAAKDAPPSLARCLADKGFVFFGASWCPYCREQKRLFGHDAANLPYVECSADGKPHGAQTYQCDMEGIGSYPTWRFPDGRLHGGVQSLEGLRDVSGCS
jgi:thiol-disulfide isomerase/thioredoxin